MLDPLMFSPLMLNPLMFRPANIGVGPFMMPPSLVQNKSNDDDINDNVVQPETNMHITAEGNKNDTDWVDTAYANNEYVSLEDPYPDEFEGENQVDMIVVKNTIVEYTRFVPPVTNNLKVVIYLNQK